MFLTNVIPNVCTLGLVAVACSTTPAAPRPTPAMPDPTAPTASTSVIPSAPWGSRPLAAAPLVGRARAFAAWTGSEMLIVGGTNEPCPGQADCLPGHQLRDAASYDPAKDRWRTISAPSEPLGTGSVVNGILYARTTTDGLVSYRPQQDAWSVMTLPGTSLPTNWTWIGAGDEILFMMGGDSDDTILSLLAWDPAKNSVRRLPPPPLPPMFAVQVFWHEGRVVVLGAELVAHPGRRGPSLLIGAIYRDAEGWQKLPDFERLSDGQFWLVSSGLLVCPDDSQADGGQVGNWGRSYSRSGILDLTTVTWRSLPPRPTGLVGQGYLTGFAMGNRIVAGDGLLLDPHVGTWSSISKATIDVLSRPDASTVWTGKELLVWGGATWKGTVPQLHNDGVALVPPPQ